ncbi:uncharacterized protein LOC112691440 isoform X2 [Sipha flava]|uniref:Uncharacterized protein LOC112691440 isoform X2 n=1 Tax=Sipha flava TaxID=143950 RepID=A0A8B8GFU9_9HEMI|nr:uncharacterized protein LOC112691440 isoform X2 [Sipha flava]
MFASDVQSIEPPCLRCMIFIFFSSDRRSAPAQVMDRDNDERLQLIALCIICGWPRFLVWLTKDQAGRGFAHHGCCAGSEEPRYDPLVHDDVGGRLAPSPAAFTDCDSQTDSLSITTVGARMAKRDFACGDSCVTLNDVCKQIYPFASEVVSDIIEANEEAHTASICDAVDSATSVCVTVEQGSPFGDDEDEIVPYVVPKMEKNRAKKLNVTYKLWENRFKQFSKFNDGIMADPATLYSGPPEVLAKLMAS